MLLYWERLVIIFVKVAQVFGTVNATEFSGAFKGLLDRIRTEQTYRTVFVLTRRIADCVDENLHTHFEVPFVNYASRETTYLKGNFNSEMLAIMCVDDSAIVAELVHKLAVDLQHMRQTRILVIINMDLEQSNWEFVHKLFELCQNLKLINVVILHRDFWQTLQYHSYTQFPAFKLETRSLEADSGVVFTNRLRNLHGKVLLTLPDLIEPRTVLYTDASGRQQLSGYVGKLLREFASLYNCTLQFPQNLSSDQVSFFTTVSRAALNDSIDISSSIAELMLSEYNMHQFTYPIEIIKLLTMLPVEQLVPLNRLLLSVFSLEFVLIILIQYYLISLLLLVQLHKEKRGPPGISAITHHLLCNDASMRGILGQSFEMEKQSRAGMKFAYFLLFLVGLFVSTTFAANLSQLLTTPPTQQHISSFDDILEHNLSIFISKEQIPYLIQNTGVVFWERYKSAFTIVETFMEFMQMRRSFNTRFGYPISTSLWSIFEEQQKYFAQKVFRISAELSYSDFLLNIFPMNENSFYKEPMNRLIMSAHNSGLFSRWCFMTFYDMVALGRMSFRDLSRAYTARPLCVFDLFWIWIFYCSAVSICGVVFVIEKCVYNKNSY